MRYLFILLILQTIFFFPVQIFAQEPMPMAIEPIIKNDVIVLRNATPQQCAAAAKGEVGPDEMESFTGGGTLTGTTGAGIRSCSDCAVDPQSKNCICQTCYYHFN